jgi:hypothetical protein
LPRQASFFLIFLIFFLYLELLCRVSRKKVAMALLLRRGMSSAVPRFGIAFDLDGTLYAGARDVASTTPSLLKLQSLGVPLLYLTNGGGCVESLKAEQLTAKVSECVFALSRPMPQHVNRCGGAPLSLSLSLSPKALPNNHTQHASLVSLLPSQKFKWPTHQ